MLVHAEATQELIRARLQDAARRAELKRLVLEAAHASEPAVNDTAGSAALRRPAIRPAILPMRLLRRDSHSRLMRADDGIAEELVLRLKTLVHMRTLLERSGASTEEIEKRTAEINRVRLRLAELVRESAEDYGSAA